MMMVINYATTAPRVLIACIYNAHTTISVVVVSLPYTLTHTHSLSETHRKRITWSVTNFIGPAALSCYKHCSLMLMNLYSQSPDFLAIKRKKKKV